MPGLIDSYRASTFTVDNHNKVLNPQHMHRIRCVEMRIITQFDVSVGEIRNIVPSIPGCLLDMSKKLGCCVTANKAVKRGNANGFERPNL